ncbi:MAG: hypothetical protein U1F76_22850 [Candidatus Competibacteraceae bacterium]
MRVFVHLATGACPELLAELRQRPPRARAERLRTLATLGLMTLRAGALAPPLAPPPRRPRTNRPRPNRTRPAGGSCRHGWGPAWTSKPMTERGAAGHRRRLQRTQLSRPAQTTPAGDRTLPVGREARRPWCGYPATPGR